ncbi:MAG: bifunctional UDP-N-acetylglucosamine diphosphorylase/glucosamine-1-phosphate N-acetyltransferase GlmU [Paracoccaceae bacterium]
MSTALIVLAAGQGTRMNSDLPKVLHKLGGFALFAHALRVGQELETEKSILVVGHGGDAVAAQAQDLDPDTVVVHQAKQRGTAHAVAQAQDALADFDGDVFVLFGDTPFIRTETLVKMAKARAENDVVVLGFEADDPGRYGRLVMQGEHLEKIVEYKDANADQRAISFCNGGIILAPSKTIFKLIEQISDDNASGEYYLTDIVEIANKQGLNCTAVQCEEAETLGINTRAQLADAEVRFQSNARATALDTGVTMAAADTVFFALDTHLGRDVVVEQNVVFGPGVTVETGATIRAFSHLEGCHVSAGAIVGPYARLRPGAEIGNDARVGNFVEIKNSEIGEGAKVGHLSYLGDAEIGGGTNIGAGTVTCNYDGVMKHRTVIGKNAFIGSDTMLVAPVTIGDKAFTATGSVITDDVPDGDLAIGRAKQVNKPGLARKLFEKLKAAKKKQEKDV